MKRYYLCPVIGTGAKGDPFRAKISDLGHPHSAVIPSDPVTGAPLFSWCLVIAGGADHTDILSDATIDAVPDIALDSKIGVLTLADRTALLGAMTIKPIDTTGLTVNSTLRDCIDKTGQTLQGAFNSNAFDVIDQ